MSKNSSGLFYYIVAAGVLFLISLWFFFHPNSPWHSRNHYIVSFKEIGDLKVDNVVNVNGLPKGYVERFELTDSCVWTKIAVLSNIKIPVNSRMRVVNVGLMGERAVEITLGNSSEYYKNNAYVMGNFDMGSTTIGTLAIDFVKEAEDIANIIATLADTLFSKHKMDAYERMGEKGKRLGNKISHLANSAERSAIASVDSLMIAKNIFTEIIDDIKLNFDNIEKNADELEKNFAGLEKSLEQLKSSIALMAEKLENSENTISLALNKELSGSLRLEMKKISQDAEQLMEKIKKDGMDLNASIF
jgi:phospholipid/cholesterol/gamma-HCH transport system substrate-binding protein